MTERDGESGSTPDACHDDAAETLLIYEPAASGHRFEYVAALLPAEKLPNLRIVLATTQSSVESPQFTEFLAARQDQFEISIVPLITGSGAWGRVRGLWQRCCQLVALWRDLRPNYTVVPDGGGIFQLMTLARQCGLWRSFRPFLQQTAIILFKGDDRPRDGGRSLKMRVNDWVMARRTWGHVLHIHRSYVTAMQDQFPGTDLLTYLPDLIQPRSHLPTQRARQQLGLPTEGRYIGLCGPINRDKGADLTLKAFARCVANASCDHPRLLLAGKVAPDIRHLIDQEYRSLVDQGQLLVMDRFLTTAEFHWAIDAVDVMALVYRRTNQPSGILLNAIMANKQVVIPAVSWFRDELRDYGLGIPCDPADSDSIATAFTLALNQPPITVAQADFLSAHSWQQFRSTVYRRWSFAANRAAFVAPPVQSYECQP